jgi:hypothetical protein
MSEQLFTTGAIRDIPDKRDYRLASIMAPIEIPLQRFVLEDIFDSKNQDGRGSCTSQAQTHHKQRQEKVKLSARFVMAVVKSLIENNTSWGAMTRNTFKAVQEWGVPREEFLPEPGSDMTWEKYIDIHEVSQECFEDAANHKCQSYWAVDKDINSIRNVLFNQKKSVVISMKWYQEFNHPINGVLSDYNINNNYSGHAVEVKGFDDFNRFLIVKNSWSEGWGDKGDFYLPYSFFNDLVWDCWCSLDIPENLPVDSNYGNPEENSVVMTWRKIYITGKFWLKYKKFPSKRELTALLWYWDYDDVVNGKHGDLWLQMSHYDAVIKGLIK